MGDLAVIRTPIGFLSIATSSNAVYKINFYNPNNNPVKLTPEIKYSVIMRKTIAELNEYFYEKRKKFNIRLKITTSPFSKKVLLKLIEVPFGDTVSYKDIAIKLKNQNAARAVGMVNKYNPISIIIPCHRVISSNGGLGGYNAGLWRKKYLLKHEGVNIDF